VELNYEMAITFLKKEALVLPNEPKGYLLVKYKNVALGWIKNIGNRCNNLYPNNWRIRMNL
jgi:NOL1/NOP2/fmu family ribosome biogenesis protein